MTEIMNVEIAGPVHRAVFPDMCACCGSARAQERILIERAFERWHHYTEPGNSRWEYTRVRLPLCSICAESHRQQEQRLSPLGRLLLLLQTWTAIPMLGGTVFAIYFFLQAFAHPSSLIVTGAFAGVFALIGLGSAAAGLRGTRHRAIPKPTSVSSCFVWSEDRSAMFEPEHRTIYPRNPAFAAAFVGANHTRIWNPIGTHARMARNWRWAFLTLLLVLGLAFAIWEQLQRH